MEWQYGQNFDNPDFQRRVTQLKRNNDLIDEIPIEMRVKIFAFDYDAEYINKLYSQIGKARKYYLTLQINRVQ